MLPERKSAAEITYRESGRRDAPALVLLHGIGSTSAGWRLQYGPLGEHFRVVAWDAPGYGGSKPLAGEAPSVEDYARALARLLDALDIRSAIIATNSWGTPTGVVFARLFPERVRALVLGGPAAGWGSAPEAERAKRIAARLERVATLGIRKMREDDAAELVAPGTRAEVLEWIKGAEGLNIDGYAQAARMLAAVDVPRAAAAVTCPAKVVAGELDRRTPPETNAKRIAAALRNGSLLMVPNCGHLPHLEYPEIFNAAVLEMLKTLSQPSAA
ncbi:MAG: alpha/beta fold hydrolase [Betaproteobacteria bacterium]|nr:alpha/beta fold hydrolase [Betaproteobacteria bacterium]